jgi:hypothetical protein
VQRPLFRFLLLMAAASSSACATHFIEPREVELQGRAPTGNLVDEAYLQVQVSSNLGDNADKIDLGSGSGAPKLIVVTAKLQPNAGLGADAAAPEVPVLTYDVEQAHSEDLTAKNLASGLVINERSLAGAATLQLIVRGISASGAATLAPLLNSAKKYPAFLTGASALVGGLPGTAFQAFIVPVLEQSVEGSQHKWERKKEHTFQINGNLSELDGKSIAFLLLTDNARELPKVDLCARTGDAPRLCTGAAGKQQPLKTPYVIFQLQLAEYRPLDDLLRTGGPCSTDRAVLGKIGEAISAGALSNRQALLEDLILRRRQVLAEIRESGGSMDRLSRAAWHFQRLSSPLPDSPRYGYWQRYFAPRAARLDECISTTVATTSITAQRIWPALLNGFRSIDEVEAAAQIYGDALPPDASQLAMLENRLQQLQSAGATPGIDPESHAYLVSGASTASSLLERYYRAEVLRITHSQDNPEKAASELKKLIAKTHCVTCASVINTTLSTLQAATDTRTAEAAVQRDNLVVDALRANARVDAAHSVTGIAANSGEVLRDAVNKSLEVKPNHADAAPALDALHGKVDAQRDRADAALDNATPPQPAPVTPVSTQSNAEAVNATATLQR